MDTVVKVKSHLLDLFSNLIKTDFSSFLSEKKSNRKDVVPLQVLAPEALDLTNMGSAAQESESAEGSLCKMNSVLLYNIWRLA